MKKLLFLLPLILIWACSESPTEIESENLSVNVSGNSKSFTITMESEGSIDVIEYPTNLEKGILYSIDLKTTDFSSGSFNFLVSNNDFETYGTFYTTNISSNEIISDTLKYYAKVIQINLGNFYGKMECTITKLDD